MRVALIGGTRFIGAATVEDLLQPCGRADRRGGHPPRRPRRGPVQPGRLPRLPHGPARTPATDAVPLDESAPTREGEQRYLYRGEVLPAHDVDPDTYENLDVEEVYAARGATVLRLPMVYGERDHQRREGFVLRRVLAGRRRIPSGPGGWLWSKGYVRDVAGAIRRAVEIGPGGVLNIAESRTVTVAAWARSILATLGHEAELVPVPEELLPDDLWITRAVAQPLLVDASRSRAVLGWNETEPSVALDRSLDWHLAHPPGEVGDLAADDRALEAAS